MSTLVLVAMALMIVSPIKHETVTANSAIANTMSDLTGLNVAVYEGTTEDGAVASRTALVHLYEWMNASVDILNYTQIQNGELENYSILAMPGGNPVHYSLQLGFNGMDAIRDWVFYGGSYFGVCGGAMFACRHVTWNDNPTSYYLRLFNGSVNGP
ncbi:MAG: BPL-N domain-containing protein, partial [Candidatus Thorarchaeota archaeon]